ncbi:MAG TPA: UDP-glucose 4-epimerase GalE [Burkholderiales bacterium]|nr:UDP-glucose 4-epimerase GalE [Burkholderiales bacterium]
MQVLVVGGAGYIGSHMVLMLAEQGHDVTVFDNFSTGYRDAVLAGYLVEGDLADVDALDRLFESHRFDAVMHFASFIQVGESVREPLKYYRNNVSNTLNLLDVMARHKVLQFVFSSTAAVFGEPQRVPIDETHPQFPVNPYGASKLMVERMLADFEQAYGLRAVSLRYFNAAGADPQGRLGERHEPETHLIPLVLEAALGKRPHITVFGRDYDTADGTCIRDYIHIVDLCSAHLAALEYLNNGGATTAFNLGNGAGYSVDEVIRVAREITGKDIPVQYGERRPGDPARLVADSTRARAQLKWAPQYADLQTIIAHAWRWAADSH